MLISVEECLPALRCPVTRSRLIRSGENSLRTEGAPENQKDYKIVAGRPILIDFSDSVLVEEEVFAANANSPISRQKHHGAKARIKRLLSPQKAGTRNNVKRLIADLGRRTRPVRLLIVGGGSVGQGMDPIYEHPDIRVYSFDIYATPNVQFVADAHHIPLPDEFFDAAIVQAVLEHVLQPNQVVSEIWRVLQPQGLVYAETPFMQQVHEGAFDFTRFTESGHRYLFRRFERLDSGANGGPGIQFMWSVDYLVRSLFRSVTAGKVAKLAFFWMQYLDRLIPAPYAEDGASGVFFYGSKSERTLSPSHIVKHYQGAQRNHG
ncbi:class I SAM-dependent methyltransferase [Rhizobium sp. P32RR-XVIII]|uniref:class I SAM-dependent methyltransferase n=1 Tax=Rhizobium sp. P32RR-XVIII TaxID=2726738 RepID=UPI0014577F2D|nr:class I SAM-dependent methyltransferase [Rhizobium sp. P32RR-XVIII]NLS07798.1 class I SAM-dependent methyltransferase [Rhizobium sp. P32RR-XVIII]